MGTLGKRDFWLSCGHRLLDLDAGGRLVATDHLLKAYLARPELSPPTDACAAERTLHEGLLAEPRRLVPTREIVAITNPDARKNWEVVLAFRNLLSDHHTIEAAYLDIIRRGIRVP